MTPEMVIEEISRQVERLNSATIIDHKSELTQNLYPILRMQCELVKAQSQRMELAENAIAEALAQMENIILPDFALELQGTLQLAGAICDLATKELGDKMSSEMAQMIVLYHTSASQLSEDIAEATLEEIPGEEQEGDEAAELAPDEPIVVTPPEAIQEDSHA